MESGSPLSSPEPGQPTQNTTSSPSRDTRKSGRVTRKPELFAETYHDISGRTKRKRPSAGDRDDGDEDGEEDEDASESDSDNASDDDPDEEELREKKRAARKALRKKSSTGPKGKPTSRAAKKPKVGPSNGVGNQDLAFRPATNGKRKPAASRPRKPKVRPSLAAGESGLYGTSSILG